MTSKPKESINCIYYVNMTIATDPINPNNTIQFTNYNNTHTLTLLIGSADSVFNKQTWWLRQLVHSKIESNNSHEYHNPIPTQYDYHILTPSSAIIYCYDAIYIPSLGVALLCWLWLPLTDYCVLAILRRFLALRSLYLKHLNRFRVQLILKFY